MNTAGQTTGVSLRATHVQRAIERMREDIDKACECVRWLIAQGFQPTHVDAGETAKPIVWIEPKQSCMKLKHDHDAHYYKTEGMAGMRRETWRAEIMGCHVQWLEIKTGGTH